MHAAIKGFIAAEQALAGGGILLSTLHITDTLKAIRDGILENVEPDLAALRAFDYQYKSSKVNEVMRATNSKMIKLLESQARLEYCERIKKTTGPSPARFLLESR